MTNGSLRSRYVPRARRSARGVLETLRLIGAPLGDSVLAVLLLALPDQTIEIYRAYARDLVINGKSIWQVPQLLLGLAAVVAAGAANWMLARNLTVIAAGPSKICEPGGTGAMLTWLPRISGALIPAGAGLGLIRAAFGVTVMPVGVEIQAAGGATAAKATDAAAEALVLSGATMLTFAAIILIVAYVRTAAKKEHKYEKASHWCLDLRIVVGFLAVTVAGCWLFSEWNNSEAAVALAQFVGAPAIICIFVLLMSYLVSWLRAISLTRKFPALGLAVIWVLGLTALELNDNHGVEPLEGRVDKPPTMSRAFTDWYTNREDRAKYEAANKPYPVFLVSAAGGALYAAEFTATALAGLQDNCPGFAQHTFAISAVSGGSLGAAVFNSMVKGRPQIKAADLAGLDPCVVQDRKRWPDGLKAKAQAYLNGDFLSPVTAAGLFPDFVQRFLPFPIGAFDRATMFEASLETAWSRADPSCQKDDCNPMRQPFLRHWDAKGSAPALILHATDVDYGYRVVISPFKITEAPDEYLALRDFHDTFMRERTAAEKAQGVGEDKVTDIALSTAIGVSARYPWFMPPASFAREGTRRRNRLLDGGIFENSGVETVHDIIQELQELEKPPKERPEALQGLPWVQFHVVIISGYQLNRPTDGPGSRGSHETAYPKGSMGGEALAPITSMLGTRVQRANMASYRLFRERGYDCAIAGQAERCREAGVRFLVLNHQDFRLPLGWQLSPYTRRVVETHIGQPQECNPVDRVRTMFTGIESEERQRYTVRENNCTTCAVLTAMRGEKFQGSTLCKR